jgi:hypothetical protein
MHRKDRSSASPLHRGGVAVQIHSMFHVLVQFEIHTIFENTAIIVQHRANPQMKLLLITLYNKPSNIFADFIADLDRLLCKLPTDALITILSGDFNVNVKKRDKQSDSLLKLVQYHGFLPNHNNVTHRAGGALDHIHKDNINNSFISTTALFRSFFYNIIHPLRAAAINYFLN